MAIERRAGQPRVRVFKRELLLRRRGVGPGEIRLDLNRKVYSAGNHCFYLFGRFSARMERMGEQKKSKKQSGLNWAWKMTVAAFFSTLIFSLASELITRTSSLVWPVLLLLVLILLAILSDLIATAVTAADQTPFVAMASRRVRGAKECLLLLGNAGKIANICGDVIGDICSILAGAAGAAMIINLPALSGNPAVDSDFLYSLLISAVTASLMIGGKAFGKHVALSRTKDVVYIVGYLLSFAHRQDIG